MPKKVTKEVKVKEKTGRKTLTAQQKQFAELVVLEAMDPLEAMFEAYPSRRGYDKANQSSRKSALLKNEKVKAYMEQLIVQLREQRPLTELYNFDMGARLLIDAIDQAKELAAMGKYTEGLHRIILSSVQELNRMYGFNLVKKDGTSVDNFTVNFIDMSKPEKDEIVEVFENES